MPPAAHASRRRFLKWTLAALGTGAVATGIDQRGEADALTVTHQTISLAGWPREAAGMRIGQLSDLHCGNASSLERAARSVEMLLAQKPHTVFLTGDFITYVPEHWAAPAATVLAPLTAVPGGAFAILGNHDWWSGGSESVTMHLEQVGIPVLRNASLPLPGLPNTWVVGLDDYCVRRSDPQRALRGVPSDALKLLLVHEPDFADVCPPGFALQLSGHSHGGQIRAPGLPPLHCPRYGQHYPEGLRQGPHHPIYTTRGVGMMGPQIRLFCPPEVTVLHLFPQA